MFRDALCFFTRLPLGAPSATASFQGVVAWMPAVGLIVGLIMAGTLGLCATLLPTPLLLPFFTDTPTSPQPPQKKNPLRKAAEDWVSIS